MNPKTTHEQIKFIDGLGKKPVFKYLLIQVINAFNCIFAINLVQTNEQSW